MGLAVGERGDHGVANSEIGGAAHNAAVCCAGEAPAARQRVHWIEQPDACLDLAEGLQFLVGQLHATAAKAGAGHAKLGAGLIERAGARHGDPVGPVGEALIAALYGCKGTLLNALGGRKEPRRCLPYLARCKCAERCPRGLAVLSECLHALAGRRAITQAEYRSRLLATLKARAALGKHPAMPLPPTPTRPDQGHRSTRLAVGGGGDNHDQSFATIAIRPALHDLLDAPAGYLSTAQVAMGEVELRWREGDGIELQQLDVLALTALNPWESLFRRWSWGVVLGAESAAMGSPDDERLQARLTGVAGYSAQPLDSLLCWGLVGADVRGFDAGKGWALGPTATAGAVWSVPGAQLLVDGRYTGYLLGEEDDAWAWSAAVRAPLTRDFALDAVIERSDRWDVLATEWSLRALWYF